MSKARQYLRELKKREAAKVTPPAERITQEEHDAERSFDVLRFLMEEPPGPTWHGSDGAGFDSDADIGVRSVRRQNRTQQVA